MRRFFYYNSSSVSSIPYSNEYSMLFDGVDEYFNCNSIAELQNVTNFSFSFWVKLGVINTLMYPLGQFTVSSNASFVSFYTNTTTRKLDFNVRGIGSLMNSSGGTSFTFSTGVWYHVACVYNGGGATNADKCKIYINGSNQSLTFVGTFPTSTGNNTNDFNIGRLIAAAPRFNGNLDEVAIFDYSLDATQVTDIYNSGTPTDLSNTTGVTAPAHWWRMGEGATFGTDWSMPDVGTVGTNTGTSVNMEIGDRVIDVP